MRRNPNRNCLVPDCERSFHAKGYCNIHHYRLMKWGDVNKAPRQPLTPEQRIENARRLKRNYKKTPRGKLTEARYVKSLIGRITKNSQTQKRRAALRLATPVWVNKTELRAFRAKAKQLGLSVDHIVPIQNEIVCGLHVPWNLQVIPLKDNLKKGNALHV